MSFRKDILEIANDIRRDVPAGLDLRQQNKLEIIRRVWAGGKPGSDGGKSDTTLELVERYKVRQLSTREIAGSGGVFETGDLRIGPITPSNGAGVGYTVAQLAPDGGGNVEVIYKLSGPHAGEYRRIALETVSDVSWFLVLRRTLKQPRP